MTLFDLKGKVHAEQGIEINDISEGYYDNFNTLEDEYLKSRVIVEIFVSVEKLIITVDKE